MADVRLLLLSITILCVALTSANSAPAAEQPNIIFIMADDLGYGDLGCYGQKLIQTPRLDRMAAEGMKFRQFYAGCTVCAPALSVLMTGMHMGHTHVRGNAGGDMSVQSLRDEDVTVAEVLKSAGYTTALCGKWGLGDDLPGARSGLPNRQGFDFFFGYLNQVHAHNYYPRFLWRNEEQVALRNVVEDTGSGYGGFAGGHATERIDYSHDLVVEQALDFVQGVSDEQPFFLYLPLTIPHANNEGTRATGDGQEIPDYGQYADADWPDQDKGQAAMISRMDADVGRLLDLLAELDLAEETIVMFTSDNGPHDEGGHATERFNPSGPLRGMKRDLYEGGIRVPFIAWGPGTVPAGTISEHVGYFGDLMASVADIAGVAPPAGIDSISFLPEITGRPDDQPSHDFLYWEFYERGGAQAVVDGHWKAVRKPMHSGEMELYDLSQDLGESSDIAADHPDLVELMSTRMDAAHSDHPNWQPRGEVPRNQPEPGHGDSPF